MKQNNTVDTAAKGQTTKKDKTPIGKVTICKYTEERRKAREKQFRDFRINALRRRCKRLGFDDEKIEEMVKKLIEQMNAPKQYSILIMVNKNKISMLHEMLKNNNIEYLFAGDDFVRVDGDQGVLATIRGFDIPSMKVQPYAKKMESVIPVTAAAPKKKKPTNNTAEKKAAAKAAKKIYGGSYRYARRQKNRVIALSDVRKACRQVKKKLKKGEKIDVQKVLKIAEERKKMRTAKTVQLKSKKTSEGLKMAA